MDKKAKIRAERAEHRAEVLRIREQAAAMLRAEVTRHRLAMRAIREAASG